MCRETTRCPKLRWSRCERTSERDRAAPANACENINGRRSGGELVGPMLITPKPLPQIGFYPNRLRKPRYSLVRSTVGDLVAILPISLSYGFHLDLYSFPSLCSSILISCLLF